MSFLFKKEKAFAEETGRYLEEVIECMRRFENAFQYYLRLEDGIDEQFDIYTREVHHLESKADDIRRDLERKLYEGAFLPHSRGDFLGLLESIDKIPNKMEHCLFNIYLQDVIFPGSFRKDIVSLVKKGLEATEIVVMAVKSLFEDLNKCLELTQSVDRIEGEADRIERDIIKSIFSTEKLDLAEKILLRDIVTGFGSISDRAEDASNRIEIIAIKRKS